MEEKAGLGLLFDLSFTEFVTTRVIKVLFVIGILFSALGTLAFVIAGFRSGGGAGLISLILSPLLFLLWVLLARIWCEIIIVVFRIAENTGRLAERSKAQPSTPEG